MAHDAGIQIGGQPAKFLVELVDGIEGRVLGVVLQAGGAIVVVLRPVLLPQVVGVAAAYGGLRFMLAMAPAVSRSS